MRRRRHAALAFLVIFCGRLPLSEASNNAGSNGNTGDWGKPPPPPDFYDAKGGEYASGLQSQSQGRQAPVEEQSYGEQDQDPPYYIDNHPPWEPENDVVTDRRYEDDNSNYYYNNNEAPSNDRGEWNPGYDSRDSYGNDSRPAQPQQPDNVRPPPPPPPPAPKYAPIHYKFPKEKVKEQRGWFGRRRRGSHDDPKEDVDANGFGETMDARTKPQRDDDGIPDTVSPLSNESPEEDRGDKGAGSKRDDDLPEFASARNDIVTHYQSTFNGKMALAASSGVAGSVLGAIVGKSLFSRPVALASVGCGLFLLCTILRNPYGELVRALGMALILALQRTSSIRRRYPTWRHIKASLGGTPRRPFPPASNPWNYQPRDNRRDVRFNMLFTLIAMAFVGSTVGGSIPLIPTWMGSLAGAGLLGLATTLQNARGDLSRSMGMRVVALCEEFLGINSELEILRKGGVVSGKLLDKALILDRQHRIKDRLISGGSFLVRQISNQVNRVQSEMQQPVDQQDGRRRADRYDEDRDRDRGRDDRPVDIDRRRRDRPLPDNADRRQREDRYDDSPRRRQFEGRQGSEERATDDNRGPAPAERNTGYKGPPAR